MTSVISAPTAVNLVRNAAYSLYLERIHEPGVLRIDHAIRIGPLVRAEFDGLSIGNKVYVTEVKKRTTQADAERLIKEIKEMHKKFSSRLKYIEKYSSKHIEKKIVVFHDSIIDNERVQEELSHPSRLYMIPAVHGKLPNQVDAEVKLLVDALIIEFFSLPLIGCKEFSSALSCNAPPYSIVTDDLRRVLRGEEKSDFAERIAEKAADVMRLSKLNPCQALYALAAALRIKGRRENRIDVLETYERSIKYVLGIDPIESAIGNMDVFIGSSAVQLLKYLTGESVEQVTLPIASQTAQRSIEIECIEEPIKRAIILLFRDLGEEAALSDVLLKSFIDVEKYYFLDRHVLSTFAFKISESMGRSTQMIKLSREERLRNVDLISTDLVLSYKRNRRILRRLVKEHEIKRIIVFHRGILTPSEKSHKRGRGSLEVM